MPFRVEDKSLLLKDGRTLQYADNGNTSSDVVILFFHGSFSVGDASRPPKVLLERHYHFVAPSLPGWGKSSAIPSPGSFAEVFAQDITTLLHHLHPKQSTLQLYISGHGFGTIAAQMLHGASYDIFPPGRSIKGLMLLSPYSPPHCHRTYSRALTWRDYFLIGPPSRICPLTCFLFSFPLSRRINSPQWVERHILSMLFPTPTESQLDIYSRWQDAYEVEDGRYQTETAGNVTRSVAKSWRGYIDIPAILHSGWGGVKPNTLDVDHSHVPVLIVSCRDDKEVPLSSAEWLADTYDHSTLVTLEGGHLSAFLQLDHLWTELLHMAQV